MSPAFKQTIPHGGNSGRTIAGTTSTIIFKSLALRGFLIGSRQMRIVLDTNVCLDLFVFRDTRWSKLLDALKNGTITAVTRDDCRMEWLIVLDAQSKLQSAAEFDALIACMPPLETAAKAVPHLPLCSDPDDQKFLELARDSRAEILITKDKALLKLARKNAKAGMFKIMTPEAWTLAFSHTAD
jgi:putative PIN family toxin of toxin-antitoxin system